MLRLKHLRLLGLKGNKCIWTWITFAKASHFLLNIIFVRTIILYCLWWGKAKLTVNIYFPTWWHYLFVGQRKRGEFFTPLMLFCCKRRYELTQEQIRTNTRSHNGTSYINQLIYLWSCCSWSAHRMH